MGKIENMFDNWLVAKFGDATKKYFTRVQILGFVDVAVKEKTIIKEVIREKKVYKRLTALEKKAIKNAFKPPSDEEIASYLNRQRAISKTSKMAMENASNNKSISEAIIGIVSKYLGITEDVIMSKSRKGDVTEARQLAMYFIKQITGMSLASIGRAFGKDHTTIIYSINLIEKLELTSVSLNKKLNDLRTLLNIEIWLCQYMNTNALEVT